MTQFSLKTTRLIEVPIEAVWDAIHDSQRWPPWWPYVVHLQESVPGERACPISYRSMQRPLGSNGWHCWTVLSMANCKVADAGIFIGTTM